MATATELPSDDLKAVVVLLADCRDEIAHATQRLARLDAPPEASLVQQHLEDILDLLTAQRTPRRLSRLWVSVGVVVGEWWFAAGWSAARWWQPPVAVPGVERPGLSSPPKGGKR
jgi:hypothetical protein